ncbi:hypothetical protein GCM10025779_03450 [Arthrobacter cryoconiti]
MQGSTLTQINRVVHHCGPGCSSYLGGTVGAAVVDTHDVAEFGKESFDNVADNGSFVVHWDNNPGSTHCSSIPWTV